MSISAPSPDLPLLFKLHGIWLVVSHENRQNCCHQMSDFKAKMHQIRFRMGLRPRPRWRSLQRSPEAPKLDLRSLLLSGGRERNGSTYKGREGEKGEGGAPIITVSPDLEVLE